MERRTELQPARSMKETRNSETTLKNIKKGHNNRTKKTEIVEVMMKKKKKAHQEQ